MSDPLAYLDDELGALAARDLLRQPATPLHPTALTFCSNDYLGLAHRPPPPAPAGAGAARLIAGERAEHAALERDLALWLQAESALLFTSGYAANLGAVSALARPGDLILSDALNHASLIDGARLSKARVEVVPHNDVGAIDAALAKRPEARALVVVESYYSMDADGPDLTALRAVCDARGAALFVDEAHALGILGPEGRGLCAAAGVRPDVLAGTLGKSLGSQGAFIVGRASLRTFLWNRARSFVFSTGLSPAAAAAGSAGLAYVRATPDASAAVLAMAADFRRSVASLIHEHGDPHLRLLGHSHVVPLVVGPPARALLLAAGLRARGVHALAVRPPTVPDGTARIRFTVTGAHRPSDVARAVGALGDALAELR